jgi:hypothetical protein
MPRRTRKQMVDKAAENEEITLRDESLEMLRRKLRRQPPTQRDDS